MADKGHYFTDTPPEEMELDEDEERLVVANPNTDRTYEDTVAGKVYLFPPLKKYRFKAHHARFLASRARLNWENQKAQAQAELNEFKKRVDHPDAYQRMKALRFADKKGNPKTVPLKYPGLVLLSTAEGLRFYDQGLVDAGKKPIAEKQESDLPQAEMESVPDEETVTG